MEKDARQTETLRARADTPATEREAAARRAAEILTDGGLVAMPTDTVYGIGVRADRGESVERLYRVKERPREKSMTVHLAAAADAVARGHCNALPTVAERLAQRFWPGALTLVVPGQVMAESPQDGELVGLRVPDHAFVQSALRQVPAPVVMPSANRSGAPPAVSFAEVHREFDGKVDAIVDGGELAPGRAASTVVLVRPDCWEVLRDGAIPAAAIRAAALVEFVMCCTGNTCRSPMAEVILRRRLEQALGSDDLEQLGITISSVGVGAFPGSLPSDGAVRAVARRGLSLAQHRSSTIDEELVERARMIYALTRGHERAILGWAPGARVTLLDPTGADIPDPIGGDDAVYEATCARIEECVEARLPEMLALAGLGQNPQTGTSATSGNS